MKDSDPYQDVDPQETREWLESIDSVIRVHGAERAHYLIERLIDETRRAGAYLPFSQNTAYVNTIGPQREPVYPGEEPEVAIVLEASPARTVGRHHGVAIDLGPGRGGAAVLSVCPGSRAETAGIRPDDLFKVR